MKSELESYFRDVCAKIGIHPTYVSVEYTENLSHGDFTSSVALAASKSQKLDPISLAEKIINELNKKFPEYLQSVEIAGPGFINFIVKDNIFISNVIEVGKKGGTMSDGVKANGSKVLVEYTDPNTFKVFHIGHVMSNAIGESLARLTETDGTKVVRICYPSDIGLHIAKSIWAMLKNSLDIPSDSATIQEKTEFLGKMYVEGTKQYEADPTAKSQIDAFNLALYQKSDPSLNSLFDKGKKWSLEHFELLYKIFGTKFDEYIYESDMVPIGMKIVEDAINSGKNIFEKSEGAIVFKGEEHGLHTRVFVSSQGLPTYETKELGLNITKFERHPDAERSIIITASEQNDYFRVLSKVLTVVDPKNGHKVKHIGHGMMRFADGKMSSRTGKVVTAEQLVSDIKDMVREKMTVRELLPDEVEEISLQVAVAAIKYTVLRSGIGSDIVFNSAESISFEGDSGPYLQYSAVRAQSVLAKARVSGLLKSTLSGDMRIPSRVGSLERILFRFHDIVARARNELAPQHVASYLTMLASAFNSFYAENIILSEGEPLSAYRVILTDAFLKTMTDGLWLLGIQIPKKM